MSDTEPPSEALQISAQAFAVEMAKHLVPDKGVSKDAALKTSVANTRKCMDNLGLTKPRDTPND